MNRATGRRGRRTHLYALALGGSWLALAAGAGPALADGSPGLGQVVFSSNRAGHYGIYVTAADGSRLAADGTDGATPLTGGPADDVEPAWSPDGQQIVFTRDEPTSTGVQGDIWVMNADGSNAHALVSDSTSEHHPAFSPDGRLIAYRRQGEVWVMSSDGSGQRAITLHAQADEPSFSPDGRTIVFTSTRDGAVDPATGAPLEQIYTLNVASCLAARCDGAAGAFTRLTAPLGCDGGPGPDSDNRSPAYSPDGTRIIFRSTRCVSAGTGRDIFVMNADGSGIRNLTDVRQADREPSWSPDGQGIVFVSTRDRTATTPNDENVYVARSDGTGLRRLTTSTGDDTDPRWYSPPGGLPVGSPGSGVGAGTPSPVGTTTTTNPTPTAGTAIRPAALDALRITLSGRSIQRIVRQHGRLVVRARCNLACSVRMTVVARIRGAHARLRFRAVRVSAPAGVATTVTLRLSGRQLAALRSHRYGRAGRRVLVSVRAVARSGSRAASAGRRVRVLS